MTQTCQIVADLGGTNARFASVVAGTTQLQHISTLQCADYPNLINALQAYLADLPPCQVSVFCMAIAGPVEQDWIAFTNNPWSFSRAALQTALDHPVVTINDFTAQAYCLDWLQEAELGWLGPQRPKGGKMRAILGPGTGLGVAGLTGSGEVIESEGGHVSFAPVNDHERDVLGLLWQRYERVSVERILSGPGLSNLYWANSVLADNEGQREPSAITTGALQGDALSLQSVSDFLDILASVAGDVALVFGASDGVYLSGGILPRMQGLIDRNRFRQRFSAKGRFQEYCEKLPLVIVEAEHIGLRGCVAALHRIQSDRNAQNTLT